MARDRPVLTVFYNTKCPICDAGINMQKNRLVQAVKAGIIEFRDINLEPDEFGGNLRGSLSAPVCKAIFNGYVTSLSPTKPIKPVLEGSNPTPHG